MHMLVHTLKAKPSPKQALQVELAAARQQAERSEVEGVAARAARDAEGLAALAEAGQRAEALTKELELAQAQAQAHEHAREKEAEQRRVDAREAERVRGELSARAAQLETELVEARETRVAERVDRRAGVEAERAAREKEARDAFMQSSSAFDTPFLSRLMCGLR